MATTNGTIKRLVSAKRFGFVAAGDGKEYFFHRSAASTRPHEDFEGVLSTIQTIEKFAGRLPEGDVEGHIRRSTHELTLAGEQRCGVEAACERLMHAVRQLDERHTTGRLRRDFENEAPSVTRLLEAIQEQLVPALKRAGYQV